MIETIASSPLLYALFWIVLLILFLIRLPREELRKRVGVAFVILASILLIIAEAIPEDPVTGFTSDIACGTALLGLLFVLTGLYLYFFRRSQAVSSDRSGPDQHSSR